MIINSAKSSSSSQVTAAQSDLALAQAEYRRFQELKTNQFVSELDLDRKRVAVAAAAARLKSLEIFRLLRDSIPRHRLAESR